MGCSDDEKQLVCQRVCEIGTCGRKLLWQNDLGMIPYAENATIDRSASVVCLRDSQAVSRQ